MPQTIVTWEDGAFEGTTILTSAADEITDDNTHEFILWNEDHSLTIEAVEFILTGNDALDHCQLPLQSVLNLRDFLLSEHVTLLLKETQ